jgi:hypothetical protein
MLASNGAMSAVAYEQYMVASLGLIRLRHEFPVTRRLNHTVPYHALQRAAALAEELAMFNNKLKQIAEKQKRQKLAAAANAAAETSSSSTTAEAAAEASLPSASGSAEPGAQPPVQAATAVTESVFSTAESPGSSAQTGAADSTPAAPPTAIGRALSTLDLLLPEDPAAQAKQRSQRK